MSDKSFAYRAVHMLFRVVNVKKMLDKSGDEFDELLEESKKKQKKPLKVPYRKMSRKFRIRTQIIGGTVCYIVRKKETTPGKAILYLFGGGYILPPDPGDIELCGQMAENCDAEVWFPLYPMAPEHRLAETLKATLGVYREMLRSYDAGNISFFGTSSGGGQCLSLCMYIKHEGIDVPMPGRLVLQSPGLQVPPSESQKEKMKELDHLDIMIPPGFFDSIAPVLAAGDEEYLLNPVLFDITGFPPIDIFYGTHEVMIAYLDDFRAKCTECGVDLTEHIGEGMMHCWGAMSFVPEAREVRQEYFAALRGEDAAGRPAAGHPVNSKGSRLWDFYAPVYKLAMKQDERIYRFMYDRIPEMIRDKEVLELATGPGLLAKHVAHAAKKMVATDFSDGMIREARKGVSPSNLTFEVCDARDLPYEDDSFDAVLIANALHVMPEPERALVEIDRVLRDGGILICPTFVEHKTGSLMSRAWSGILNIAGVKFEHQWTGDEYLEWIREHGWKITYSKLMSARISLMYVECVK